MEQRQISAGAGDSSAGGRVNRSARKAAAVTIFAHRPSVSAWERIGLQQCASVLSKHDKILVCPRGMATNEYTALLPGVQIFAVDPKLMGSYIAYADFKTSPLIYTALQDKYRFMLCHEPDVFVFRDEVEQWCDSGFDYIGAPWFSGRPTYPDDAHIVGVGNGGFSLRNNDAHVRASRSVKLLQNPRELWSECRDRSPAGRVAGVPTVALKSLGIGNSTNYHLRAPYLRWRNKVEHEDLFWTEQAAKVLPWFKVADADTAMRFSFEVLPHKLYEMTGHQLPFGCHGWFKFGLEFWRPFIEAEGYELPTFGPWRPSVRSSINSGFGPIEQHQDVLEAGPQLGPRFKEKVSRVAVAGPGRLSHYSLMRLARPRAPERRGDR